MLPDTEPVPLPLAEDWLALKDAVKRFEQAWRQGPRPAIDDYLPAGDPLRVRVLIELVHIDLELRLKAGEAARVEEYLARYPELTDDRDRHPRADRRRARVAPAPRARHLLSMNTCSVSPSTGPSCRSRSRRPTVDRWRHAARPARPRAGGPA